MPLTCPDCGSGNREGRRFCAECGASLALACAECGFSNDPGEKFCGGCGIALGGAAPPGGPAPAEPPSEPLATAGERRQVTVLFADLSGFTKLSGTLDPEETHALLNAFFEAVDGVIEGFGGTVDKHIGDGVMAVFGAPVAHGNDAERAVRAALEIHAAMPDLSARLGHPMAVHSGLASGEVVASGVGSAGHQDYTVTGDSVNLASRLQEMAAPGETLISEAVHGATAALVACDEIDDIEVRGIEKPVKVWRVRALERAADEDTRLPLIGRDAEMRQFQSVIESCRETGRGQTVYVRGEAGIGKTRLVAELRGLAEARGFASHTGLVLDFGVGRGQDAVRALVRSLLGIAPGSGKAVRAAAAEEALQFGLLTDDQSVFLNDLLDLPQPQELRALYEAMDNDTRNNGKQETVAALIEAVSDRQPVMAIVEDIHWAGERTLAYLARMAVAVSTCPAVLVMTSRIEGDPLDQVWRGSARGSRLMTVDLAPLSDEDAAQLAGGFIDATTSFAMNCVARAEGNPLFLEQLLRSAGESSEDTVPGSVQSIVQARMDSLDAPDKRALQAASVIGQRFSLDLLRHLVGDPRYAPMGLVEHFLVRPEGDDYLFAHALVREGVYSSLLKAGKGDLHRAAAAWFADRDPSLYAEHLARAEDPEAPRAYLEAARIETERYRYANALQLVDRGLELGGETATRYDLTCLRGDVLRDLGATERSIDAFRAALELADDDGAKCQAWIGLAEGMRVSDIFDDALEALDLAEKAATRQGLTGSLARIHSLRGNLYFPLGNIDGCLEQHGRALELAREAGLPEREAQALGGLGDAYYQRGRMITACDHFDRCIDLCRAHGFGGIETAYLYMRGVARHYRNELEAAREDSRAAVEAAAKAGQHRAEVVARVGCLAVILSDMMDHEGMRVQAEQGLALARRIGARRFEPSGLMHLAQALAAEGRQDEALASIEEALAICHETGITFSGPWVLGALAVITDDEQARREALREGEAVLADDCVSHSYFWFYRYAMEASLDSGNWDETERYAAALDDYTRPEPLPWTIFFIRRGRALARHGRGARDEATMAELGRLVEEARLCGLRSALPTLERALEGSLSVSAG